MTKITTRTIETFLDEKGILHIKIFKGSKIDLDDAVNNFLIIKQLSNGQKRLKLVDTRTCWKITKKAKNYSLKEDTPKRTIAKAILVRGIIRMLINTFLMNKNKPSVPIKYFLFEKRALKWLNSFEV